MWVEAMARNCWHPLLAYWRTHEHSDEADSDEQTDHQKSSDPEKPAIHLHNSEEAHIKQNNGHLDHREAGVIHKALDKEDQRQLRVRCVDFTDVFA